MFNCLCPSSWVPDSSFLWICLDWVPLAYYNFLFHKWNQKKKSGKQGIDPETIGVLSCTYTTEPCVPALSSARARHICPCQEGVNPTGSKVTRPGPSIQGKIIQKTKKSCKTINIWNQGMTLDEISNRNHKFWGVLWSYLTPISI